LYTVFFKELLILTVTELNDLHNALRKKENQRMLELPPTWWGVGWTRARYSLHKNPTPHWPFGPP